MRRQLVSCLSCLILLLTLVLVPGSPVHASVVAVYDTASYCNVPAANPGDPAYSEMAVEQFVLGFGCQYVNGTQLAETFILGEGATIGAVELFAYQTGSSTTPSFTGAYLAIYDGNPADGASIIWGDMVTNRFESSVFTGCIRVMHGSTDTQRPIMKIVADGSTESGPGLELAAGTYWLAFSLDGSLFSGPWGVPNILDTPYTAGTAIQYVTDTWQNAVDSGTGVQASIPLRLLAVEKQPQPAPDAPVVSELTDISVTLEAITGAEYKLDDGAWQTDLTFTGLSPNTAYSLYVRLAETATHLASPESAATTVTTHKSAQTAPAAPVAASITETAVTLEHVVGAEYRLNDGAWQMSPEFTGLTPDTTYRFYVRLAETETPLASTDRAALQITLEMPPPTGEHSSWTVLALVGLALIVLAACRIHLRIRQKNQTR